jgi:hypothetical protein
MFKLKYDHRYAFLLSYGVLLFCAGIYPFYLIGFPFSKDVYHFLASILGVVFIVLGINIWNERDKDEKEIREFTKEEMKRNNELKKVAVGREKLIYKQDLIRFNKVEADKEFAESKAKAKEKKEKAELSAIVKKLEKSHSEKLKSIEKLEKEVTEKTGELLEKENEIYSQRTKAINELPDSLTFGVTSDITSGMTISDQIYSSKTCMQCRKLYAPSHALLDIGLCDDCRYPSSGTRVMSTDCVDTTLSSCRICHKPYFDILGGDVCDNCKWK